MLWNIKYPVLIETQGFFLFQIRMYFNTICDTDVFFSFIYGDTAFNNVFKEICICQQCKLKLISQEWPVILCIMLFYRVWLSMDDMLLTAAAALDLYFPWFFSPALSILFHQISLIII